MMICQFGNFLFPTNPREIQVRYRPEVLYDHLPPSRSRLRRKGAGLRQVVCKGVFFAPSPEKVGEIWRGLLTQGDDRQLLFLPGEPPFWAILESYSMTLEQDGRVLPYTLQFVEEDSHGHL